MEFVAFQVTNYRNVVDSGPIGVNRITAFVGQNEAGKSNLFDALYRVNPFDQQAVYNLDETGPLIGGARRTPGRTSRPVAQNFNSHPTKSRRSTLTPRSQLPPLLQPSLPMPRASTMPQAPANLTLIGIGAYGKPSRFVVEDYAANIALDEGKADEWAKKNAPKFVYIHDVELSGHQMVFDHLKNRRAQVKWDQLSNDEQTVSVILDLAKINLDAGWRREEAPKGVQPECSTRSRHRPSSRSSSRIFGCRRTCRSTSKSMRRR